MQRTFLVLIASVIALATALQAQEASQSGRTRKIPCKTDANATMCYWTHGRLSFYNGTPAYRIWKVGTKRLFGVYSGPSIWNGDTAVRDNEDPELPANVKRVYRTAFEQVFADFEVCPLEPEKRGTMQPVCIESAKGIFVQKNE